VAQPGRRDGWKFTWNATERDQTVNEVRTGRMAVRPGVGDGEHERAGGAGKMK
jgi:hypothetical protein